MKKIILVVVTTVVVHMVVISQNLQLVSDINTDPAISSQFAGDIPQYLTGFNGKIYFSGKIKGVDRELRYTRSMKDFDY